MLPILMNEHTVPVPDGPNRAARSDGVSAGPEGLCPSALFEACLLVDSSFETTTMGIDGAEPEPEPEPDASVEGGGVDEGGVAPEVSRTEVGTDSISDAPLAQPLFTEVSVEESSFSAGFLAFMGKARLPLPDQRIEDAVVAQIISATVPQEKQAGVAVIAPATNQGMQTAKVADLIPQTYNPVADEALPDKAVLFSSTTPEAEVGSNPSASDFSANALMPLAVGGPDRLGMTDIAVATADALPQSMPASRSMDQPPVTSNAPLPLSGFTPSAAMRQVADAVLTIDGSTVEVALSPEELGSVKVAIIREKLGMVVSLQVERPEILELMRRNTHILQEELRTAGSPVAELRFSLSDQHDGQDKRPQNASVTGAVFNNAAVQDDGEAGAPRYALGPDRLDLRV